MKLIQEPLKLLRLLDEHIYTAAFVLAAGATLASFVLSQVVGFIPCTLCWYQRILMFPLPLILGAAVLRHDRLAFVYTLPLAAIGTMIAAYHSLLQWGIITHETNTCSLTGSSCAAPEVLWFGFLTIPFGSFLAFLAISALMGRAIYINGDKVFNPASQKRMQWILLALAGATITAITIIEIIQK